MRFHVLSSTMLVTILALLATAEAPAAAVSGTVINEAGQPLEGAAARLLPVASSGRGSGGGGAIPSPMQTTDASGGFAFDSVPNGLNVLEITLPGFRPYRELLGGSGTESTGRQIRMRLGESPDAMPWVSSLATALQQAGDDRLPAMIFMTMDNEPGCDRMAANVYREPSVAEMASHLFPVRASAAQRSNLVSFYFNGPAVQVPAHMFLTPGGGVIARRVFELDAATVRNMMIEAIRFVNPDRAIEAATQYYADLSESLRFGDTVDRGHAFENLLRLARAGDEVARTAMFAANPSSLSAAQESELLDVLLRRMDVSTSGPFGRLVSQGSTNLRAEAIGRVAELEATRAYSAYLAILSYASDAPTRASAEAALGVRRDASGLRFTGLSEKRDVQVAMAMARHGDRAALDTLFEAISDAGSPRRTDAAISLLHYRADDVMPYLKREIAKGGVDAALLARIVGELRDRRGTEILLSALADGSLGLRMTASMALGRIGDRRAVAALTDLVRSEDLDEAVRVAAAAALVDLGSDEGVQVLIEAADDPVFGDGARDALRKAHATSVPRSSEEWRRWWDDQPGGDS